MIKKKIIALSSRFIYFIFFPVFMYLFEKFTFS